MWVKNKLSVVSAVVAVIATGALALPFVSSAEVINMTTAQMQAEIAQLTAEVQLLEQQLIAVQGGTGSGGGAGGGAGGGTAPVQWCHTFNTNMGVGATGSEVVALQMALQKQNIMEIGPDSGIYDETTASLVTSFQEKYASQILAPVGLVNGTGYVGAGTRAELNGLYGCSVSTQSAPVITSVTPNTGPSGTEVTITGTNFTPTNNTVIGVPGNEIQNPNISSPNGTTLTFPLRAIALECPAGVTSCSPAGVYQLTVSNGNGTSNALPFTLTDSYKPTPIPPPISITSVTPSFGSIGSKIVITGSGFSQLTLAYPGSGPYGQGIWLTNGSVWSYLGSPSTARIDGDNTITTVLTGSACPGEQSACSSNFSSQLTPGNYSLYIDSDNGLIVSNKISFTVNGTGCCTPAGPNVTGITPTSASVGTNVTVTGTGFGASNTILFNGSVAATNVPSNGTSLTFAVPQSLGPNCPTSSTSPVACPAFALLVTSGTYQVSVMTNGVTSGSASLTVTGTSIPPTSLIPVVTGLSQVSGPIVAGSATFVLGSNFDQSSGVYLDGISMQTTYISGQSLQFTLPSNTSIGSHQLFVTGKASQSNTVTFSVGSQTVSASPSSIMLSATQGVTAGTPQTLSVSAPTGLAWSIAATGAPWLTISPTGNGISYSNGQYIGNAQFSISANPAIALSPGTYQSSITISGAFTNSPISIPVTLTLGSSPYQAPSITISGGPAQNTSVVMGSVGVGLLNNFTITNNSSENVQITQLEASSPNGWVLQNVQLLSAGGVVTGGSVNNSGAISFLSPYLIVPQHGSLTLTIKADICSYTACPTALGDQIQVGINTAIGPGYAVGMTSHMQATITGNAIGGTMTLINTSNGPTVTVTPNNIQLSVVQNQSAATLPTSYVSFGVSPNQTVNWTAKASPSWLVVAPSGSAANTGSASVSVTSAVSSFPIGQYAGTIIFSPGAGSSFTPQTVNVTLAVGPAAPVVPSISAVSLTPSSGSTAGPQTFSATFTDTVGASEIQHAYVSFINNNIPGPGMSGYSTQNGCIVTYNKSNNAIALSTDLGTAYQPPMTIGQAGTESNSQCTLNAQNSSISVSGNSFSFNPSITFLNWGGSKNSYIYADNGTTAQNQNSGWVQKGTWTVPAVTGS